MDFDLKSIFFLHGGKIIEDNDYKLTIQKKFPNSDIEKKIINILVYKYDKDSSSEQIANNNGINILFILDSNQIYKKKATWDTVIKNICDEYIEKNNLNRKLIIFRYNDETIDLTKKFIDIANQHDKDCGGITINVYTGHSIKVKFYYKIYRDEIDCNLEDNVKDIFKNYTRKKFLHINNLDFYYKENPIQLNSNQTFKQLIHIDYENSSSTISILKKLETIFNEEIGIKIKVIEKRKKFVISNKPIFYSHPKSYCKNKKK